MQRTPDSGKPLRISSYPDLSIESQGVRREDIIRNVNIRKRKNPDYENMADFKEEIMEFFKQMMKTEIDEIKQQNSEILSSNSQILKLLECNAVNYNEIINRVQIIEAKQETEMIRIDELESQLNELQKQSFKNTIEIRNILREDKEDVHKIVKNIYTTLNLPAMDETLNIYRRGKYNGPIIVEYQDTKNKEAILRAAKKYNIENKDRPLNSKVLGIGEEGSRVYISEALTPVSKKILAAARELVKKGTYKYCWVARGNILLRKEEGQPAIVIKTLNKINELGTQ